MAQVFHVGDVVCSEPRLHCVSCSSGLRLRKNVVVTELKITDVGYCPAELPD